MRLTPEIIAGMQQLAVEQRRLLGPRAPWHVGDVAWGLRQHEGREPEWTFRLRHDDDGRVVAWSWLKGDRGLLEYDLHPDHRHLLDELLDEPDARQAVAFEDDAETRAALARHGFTKPGRSIHFNHREVTEAPTPPPLPDGFRYRTVEPNDLAERVAVHRDVWEPSHVTESSYRTVMAEWPYRGSLDCVVEAPDGRFASYVLSGPTMRTGSGSSSRSARVRSFGAAASARPSARSACSACTRKACGTRSSAATPSLRAHSTSRSAFAAAGRSSPTHDEPARAGNEPVLPEERRQPGRARGSAVPVFGVIHRARARADAVFNGSATAPPRRSPGLRNVFRPLSAESALANANVLSRGSLEGVRFRARDRIYRRSPRRLRH